MYFAMYMGPEKDKQIDVAVPNPPEYEQLLQEQAPSPKYLTETRNELDTEE